MKILHLGKYYSPFEGGIENFLKAYLKSRPGSKAQHIVLAHHHRLRQKTCVEKFPEGSVIRVFTLCRLLFAPIAPTYYYQLRKVLAREQPDLVHVHMPNLSAFWLLLLVRKLACPVVVHWHADVIASRRNRLLALAYLFYRPLEKRLLEVAAGIIVTSPNYRDSSIPLRPFRHKCHVIPLGLDPGKEEAVAEGKNFWRHEEHFKVLCIGRLTYYKGQQFLIEAISSLAATELILVGTGKNLKSCQELIVRLQCGDRVALMGHAEPHELEQLLLSCDCLCLPSIERTEAFGLVLLEAMRYGKPCICTDVAGSGMSWVVQDGETGLVVKQGDSAALVRAIRELSANPEITRAYGEAGRERLHTMFSIDRVADEIDSLYNDVLNTSS